MIISNLEDKYINQFVIYHKDLIIFISYKDLVAIIEDNNAYIINKELSKNTTRHLNKFIQLTKPKNLIYCDLNKLLDITRNKGFNFNS